MLEGKPARPTAAHHGLLLAPSRCLMNEVLRGPGANWQVHKALGTVYGMVQGRRDGGRR